MEMRKVEEGGYYSRWFVERGWSTCLWAGCMCPGPEGKSVTACKGKVDCFRLHLFSDRIIKLMEASQ